eukprot:TRINITY_DN1299_c1_g1_i6.p1 TRINITY_DN1299_c1_g1~~TRINITY_DN1299_c1_g1_i6.p1  ORF type:complete len:710 (+),score=189.78 TRINITY_DN1299_c1_g1_i6:19-2148(+)
MERKYTYSQKRRLRKNRRNTENTDIERLNHQVTDMAPPKGSNPLADDLRKADGDNTDYEAKTLFKHLPISKRTLMGLESSDFIRMTDIQRAALPHALAGRDILGAAKTGSGKTLAFLIPVIEVLYRNKWSQMDGLGALVLSPTRELAFQTFKVLQKIGARHDSLSAGLVIGGNKNVREERERIPFMNILICTPGRFLQHLDETPYFSCDNLQMLVLDEADKILDMGFKKELNAILMSLPKKRQTLLFSATQQSSVRQLARLSLQEPEYLSVHAEESTPTPKDLIQNYLVCDLDKKLDFLWSFVRAHTNNKCMVFLSTQKQVRYVFEVFRKMRPGVSLIHLHGKMSQNKRTEIYLKFTKSKSALLLCTDLASRGLDFKRVDWVIQMDCPSDVDTYIHRAGRTARLSNGGRALLVVMPQEESIIEQLEQRDISIKQIKINPNQAQSIQLTLQNFLLEDPNLKYLAQKTLSSYLRSLHLAKIDVQTLPLDGYAKSLGLVGAPNISISTSKSIDKNEIRKQNKINQLEQMLEEAEESVIPLKVKRKGQTKMDKLFNRKNNSVLSEAFSNIREEEEDDDDLLVKKTENQAHLRDFGPSIDRRKKKKKYENDGSSEEEDNFVERVVKHIEEKDSDDLKEYNKKIRETKLKKKSKLKKKEKIKLQNEAPMPVVLGPASSISSESIESSESSEEIKQSKKRKRDKGKTGRQSKKRKF